MLEPALRAIGLFSQGTTGTRGSALAQPAMGPGVHTAIHDGSVRDGPRYVFPVHRYVPFMPAGHILGTGTTARGMGLSHCNGSTREDLSQWPDVAMLPATCSPARGPPSPPS